MRRSGRIDWRTSGAALLLLALAACSEEPRYTEAPETSLTKVNSATGYVNAERRTFAYDGEGRLVLETTSQWIGGTWQDDASYAAVYDADGLLSSRTSGRVRVTYEYADGLLSLQTQWKRDDQSAEWVADRRRSYSYDGDGHLVAVADSRLVSGAFADDCRQRFSYSGGTLPVGIDRYCPGEDGTFGATPLEHVDLSYDGSKLTAMVESDAGGSARRTALTYAGDELTRFDIETKSGGGDAVYAPAMTVKLSRSGSTVLATVSQWTGTDWVDAAQVETKLTTAGNSSFLGGVWVPEPVHRDWREWLYYGASPTWR